MKTTATLLLILFAVLSSAQETATTSTGETIQLMADGTYKKIPKLASAKDKITDSDVVFSGNNRKFSVSELRFLTPDDKPVMVNVALFASNIAYTSSGMDAAKINNMMFKSYYRAMFSVKNKYTFSPKKVIVHYYDKYDIWSATTSATAQNDYGATKDVEETVYFDNKGEKEIGLADVMEKK